MLIRGIVMPIISDVKGRKLSLFVTMLVSGVSVIIMGLSPNILLWSFFIPIAGFGFAGIEIISLAYTAEISGRRFRNHSGAAFLTVWGLSQVLLGFIFTFQNNWRYIFIFVIGLPCLVFFLVAIFLFDETPRYLVSTGNITVSNN